jgi:hypothetical protein
LPTSISKPIERRIRRLDAEADFLHVGGVRAESGQCGGGRDRESRDRAIQRVQGVQIGVLQWVLRLFRSSVRRIWVDAGLRSIASQKRRFKRAVSR